MFLISLISAEIITLEVPLDSARGTDPEAAGWLTEAEGPRGLGLTSPALVFNKFWPVAKGATAGL